MNEDYYENLVDENEIIIKSLTESLTKEDALAKTDGKNIETGNLLIADNFCGKSKAKKVKKNRKCTFEGCNGSGNILVGKTTPKSHYTYIN